VKSFAKCLAHDGTLKGCVPLVPKVHTLLSCAETCLKFSLYSVLNENSNMMISKLRGVSHTQSCDPPRGLEII
jgi:hypothetical protein